MFYTGIARRTNSVLSEQLFVDRDFQIRVKTSQNDSHLHLLFQNKQTTTKSMRAQIFKNNHSILHIASALLESIYNS